MNRNPRLAMAEALGPGILVIGGPGGAILAGKQIGNLGVALAFGLSLRCAGVCRGEHLGLPHQPGVDRPVLGKTKTAQVPRYVAGQMVGGLLGALAIFGIADGVDGFSAMASGFASNGWGDHLPGGYNFGAMVVVEVVLTALFVLVVVSTSRRSMPVGFTGVTVGFMLSLVHLISIPVDNTSVNPARSLATAVFQHDWALRQLWAFIVFPLAGAVLGGLVWKALVPVEDA